MVHDKTAQAMSMGALACSLDLPRTSNPFELGTDLNDAWDEGFNLELASWRAARQAYYEDMVGGVD